MSSIHLRGLDEDIGPTERDIAMLTVIYGCCTLVHPGITGTALAWFRSDLSNRFQAVGLSYVLAVLHQKT